MAIRGSKSSWMTVTNDITEGSILGPLLFNILIKNLDTHKSMGPDGIQPRVLRELVEDLVKALSVIYQQSWLTVQVPDD